MINVNQLYNKCFDTYKQNYDSEYLNKEDKKLFDPIHFKVFDEKKQKPKSTEENAKRKMQKPL